MIHNRLQLNDSKTDILIITAPCSAVKHKVTDAVIGDSILKPTTVPRNLGVMFDSAFNMKSQVSRLCQTAYYHLHKIRAIRDCLTQHATELLVHALVISRLDYGNSLLYGLPDVLLDKRQRAHNAAARVAMKACRYDHVTPILETLHWLPVQYRIQYTIILTTYKVSHLLAPIYLSDLLEFYQPIRTLRSSSESLVVVHRAHLRQFGGNLAFYIAAPHLWNDLPSNMRTCDSLCMFKRLLKTYLFKRAFYS